MMRRFLIGAAMVLAFLAPGTAAAASLVKLARLDARFPERSFLVSLPQSRRPDAGHRFRPRSPAVPGWAWCW